MHIVNSHATPISAPTSLSAGDAIAQAPTAPIFSDHDAFEPSDTAEASNKPNIEPQEKIPTMTGRLRRSWDFLTSTASGISAQALQALRLLGNSVLSVGQSIIGFVSSPFAKRGNTEGDLADLDALPDAPTSDVDYKTA
jgi:hypothetical protein